jgi:hypothetical protein
MDGGDDVRAGDDNNDAGVDADNNDAGVDADNNDAGVDADNNDAGVDDDNNDAGVDDDNNDADVGDGARNGGEGETAKVVSNWICLACCPASKNCIVLAFKMKFRNAPTEFLLIAFELYPNFCILWSRVRTANFWDVMVQNEKVYIVEDHEDVVVFSAFSGDYIEEDENLFLGPAPIAFNFFRCGRYRFQRLVSDYSRWLPVTLLYLGRFQLVIVDLESNDFACIIPMTGKWTNPRYTIVGDTIAITEKEYTENSLTRVVDIPTGRTLFKGQTQEKPAYHLQSNKELLLCDGTTDVDGKMTVLRMSEHSTTTIKVAALATPFQFQNNVLVHVQVDKARKEMSLNILPLQEGAEVFRAWTIPGDFQVECFAALPFMTAVGVLYTSPEVPRMSEQRLKHHVHVLPESQGPPDAMKQEQLASLGASVDQGVPAALRTSDGLQVTGALETPMDQGVPASSDALDQGNPAASGVSADPGAPAASGVSADPGAPAASGVSADPGAPAASGVSVDPGAPAASGVSADPGASASSGVSADPGAPAAPGTSMEQGLSTDAKTTTSSPTKSAAKKRPASGRTSSKKRRFIVRLSKPKNYTRAWYRSDFAI